jgi:hypothetical protein
MTCVHSHRQVLWWYGTAYAIVLWSIAAATGEWVYPNMDWSDPYSLVAYVLLPILPFIAFLLWCAAALRAHPRAPGNTCVLPRARSRLLVRTCFHPESRTPLHAPLCSRQPIYVTWSALGRAGTLPALPSLGRGKQSVSQSAAKSLCRARQVLLGCAAARVAGPQADGRTAPRRGSRSGRRTCSRAARSRQGLTNCKVYSHAVGGGESGVLSRCSGAAGSGSGV